jgi:hypothetical protein
VRCIDRGLKDPIDRYEVLETGEDP